MSHPPPSPGDERLEPNAVDPVAEPSDASAGPPPRLSFRIQATAAHKRKRALLSNRAPPSTGSPSVSTPASAASVSITSFTPDPHPAAVASSETAAPPTREVVIPALPNAFLPWRERHAAGNEGKADRDGDDEENASDRPSRWPSKSSSGLTQATAAAEVARLASSSKKRQREDSQFQFGSDNGGSDSEDDMHGTIPIEEFGKAMLRGMGWREGEGIGRDKSVVVQPIVAKARPKLAGIGSDLSKIRAIQREQRRTSRTDTMPSSDVAATGTDSPSSSSYRSLEHKLLETRPVRLQRDCVVSIVSGPHEGLIARVLREPSRSGRVLARLNLNRLEAKLWPEEVELLDLSKLDEMHEARVFARQESTEGGMMDEEDATLLGDSRRRRRSGSATSSSPPPPPPPPLANRCEHGRSVHIQTGSYGSTRHSERGRFSGDRVDEHMSQRPSAWLTPHIRVRVISKSFYGGKYYQQKGVVIDVPRVGYCTVRLDSIDDGRVGGQMPRGSVLLEDVPQHVLETVIPKKRHSLVLCVAGEHRGRRAIMMDRDRRKQIGYLHFVDDVHDYGHDHDGTSGQHLVAVHFDDMSELAPTR